MAVLSGDIRKANAIFLLVLTPIVVRIWYEAVVRRLERGPQMLGFEVVHGAAGGALAVILAPLLLFSLLAAYIYLLWVIVVLALRLIPRQRQFINAHFAAVGALCFIAFGYITDHLQGDSLSHTGLLRGAFVLTVIVLIMAWLVYSGFRKSPRAATAPPHRHWRGP